jgi:hypothetical protein
MDQLSVNEDQLWEFPRDPLCSAHSCRIYITVLSHARWRRTNLMKISKLKSNKHCHRHEAKCHKKAQEVSLYSHKSRMRTDH